MAFKMIEKVAHLFQPVLLSTISVAWSPFSRGIGSFVAAMEIPGGCRDRDSGKHYDLRRLKGQQC